MQNRHTSPGIKVNGLPKKRTHRVPKLESSHSPSTRKIIHKDISYQGCDKLLGKIAVVTASATGIGRAVAIAFAREGADILLSYADEHEEAQETAHWVKKAGRHALLVPGPVGEDFQCQLIVQEAVRQFGKIDILVNIAKHQPSFEEITDITSQEWDASFHANIYSIFYLCKAAVPHMEHGGSIINTASFNHSVKTMGLLSYVSSMEAIGDLTVGLARSLAKHHIRVNGIAPDPSPSNAKTALGDKNERSRKKLLPTEEYWDPIKVAPVYVLLASDEARYISGAMIPITGFPSQLR